MQKFKPLFVAETREDGVITAVWIKEGPGRSARVLGDPRLLLHMHETADFAGADPKDFLTWAEHQTRASS